MEITSHCDLLSIRHLERIFRTITQFRTWSWFILVYIIPFKLAPLTWSMFLIGRQERWTTVTQVSMMWFVLTYGMRPEFFIWFAPTSNLKGWLCGTLFALTPRKIRFATKKPSLPLNKQDILWLYMMKSVTNTLLGTKMDPKSSWKKNNCLQRVMAYEAKASIAFVQTTPIGKGLYPIYVINLSCSNACWGRRQIRRPLLPP